MQQHAATFFAQAEDAAGADLPQFVKDEFDAFLARKPPRAKTSPDLVSPRENLPRFGFAEIWFRRLRLPGSSTAA